MTAATATDASVIGMSKQLGGIHPGMLADVIAVAGDPTQQIEALSREVVALQAAYEAENDARQKAQEDARRARETLATLAALANEEGGTNGRGA